jgi:hypothetical protein
MIQEGNKGMVGVNEEDFKNKIFEIILSNPEYMNLQDFYVKEIAWKAVSHFSQKPVKRVEIKDIAKAIYKAKKKWDDMPDVAKRDLKTKEFFEPGIMWFAQAIQKLYEQEG